MNKLPEPLPKDKQDGLACFLKNETTIEKFYVGNNYGPNILFEIHDPFGLALLKVKAIGWLPSCKAILQKTFGWMSKRSYFIESSKVHLFEPAYVQMKVGSSGFGDITLFSESCEELFSLDQKGYSFDVQISGKSFNGLYFLDPSGNICSAVFDDKLDCKLCLSPEEDVPKFMERKRAIYADKNLSSMEKTSLTFIALLPEISFRLMPGGD